VRRLTTLAVVATMLLAVGAGCSDGGLEDLRRPSATSTTVQQIAPTITTPPTYSGQALVVEDQGVTSFTDPYDKSAVLGGYAVILRNPDPQLLAAGVRVRTSILDAAGAELLVDTATLNGIMPGARMAVGRTLIEDVHGPASLRVAVEVTEWQPPAFTQLLTAEAVSTDKDVYGGAATRFAVRSTLPVVEQGVDVTAVYRDQAGKLLAGESSTLSDVAPGATVLGQIPLIAPIPGTASTEVLVGRGFAAQTVG
jgi:hypothetical protein